MMKFSGVILLLTLFCIHNSFNLSLSHPPSNETDYQSLLEFKNGLTNADHLLGNNWTSTTSFCTWIGVTCSRRRQRVTALILSDMGLEGEISPSIGNLTFLITLDLRNNTFHGNFPFDQCRFPRLTTLNLSRNNLSGSLHPSIGNFTRLQHLYLYDNNIGGEIPGEIENLGHLRLLNIRNNHLTGSIPPSLGNLSALQVLNFRENMIGGTIPTNLGKLSNLEMLNFEYNNLTGEIPPLIFNLSSVTLMAFTTNNLSGHLPDLHLPNLEGIYLHNNMLRGVIPLSITNATKLQVIELSVNMFVGPVPFNLGNLKELVTLSLGSNHLTNEPGGEKLGFFDSLVECRKLENLVVSQNPLGGSLPDSIRNLSASILRFGVELSQISGSIPAGIGNLSGLIALTLNGNSLTGNIPVEMGNLRNLQMLYLPFNRLQGEIPTELCNLVNLGAIFMSGNELYGSIPSCIGNLTRIQRIGMFSNRLASTLPSGLWELDGLLSLDLSNNQIQGELHSDIRKLNAIVRIDLSKNQFSGSIPDTLGELKALVLLNLSSNSLNGSVPPSFSNLVSLEALDLSGNNLSGSIPASLELLSHLRVVNFSYNQLQGQIPQDGIFLNSSRGAFEGNIGLCGMPSLGFQLCRADSSSRWSRSKKLIMSITIPAIASVTLVSISLSVWLLLKRRKSVKQEDVESAEISGPKKITYHEIFRGTDGFSEANLLGVGSSGSVFKAILPDEEVVAVKVLNSDGGNEGKKRFDAECEVLKQIRHRNLVQIITTCSNDNLRAIILPYMPNGNLETWLYDPDRVMNFEQRIDVMLDVAMAVEYLHHGNDSPVVHCDLKPSNVLLDADMVAHVSDFGISKIVGRGRTSVQTKTLGTIGYIAPEYGSEGIASTAGDVYSYGIMLMEVLVRRRPTDELFTSNLSLRKWVEEAYPNSLNRVLDINLFQDHKNESVQYHTSVLSLVELSLRCSSETPEERINMKDAVLTLIKIKRELVKL